MCRMMCGNSLMRHWAVSAPSCSNGNKAPSAMLRKPVYAAQGSPAPYPQPIIVARQPNLIY